MDDTMRDGGPVHPVRLPIPGALHANGDPPPTQLHTGISLRAHIATEAMHGLITEPTSDATSLVQYLAPTEPGDAFAPGARIARAAVVMADALLDALDAPRPAQYRSLYPMEQRQIEDAERLANAVNAAKDHPAYSALPTDLRQRIEKAVDDVLDPEIPF